MDRIAEPRPRSLLVALVALAAHAPVLFSAFVWLDHGDLEAGAALVPPSQWLALFTHGFARTGFYRPLPALSLSFDALWGGGPFAFHLHSLLLHALVAVSVGFAADALGLKKRVALVAALLFAAHPIGGFVGGLIAFRPELLMSLSLLWLVVALKHQRPGLAAVLLLAGGLSKETALVLGPLVVLALWPGRRYLLAAAAGWVAAVGLRLAFAPPWQAAAAPLSGLEAVGTRLEALVRGVGALLVPWQTDWCDATEVTSLTVGGVGVALILLALAWLRRPAGLLFAASLLPALNLVPAPRFWSLHYFYLPLAFAVLLLGGRGVRWLLGVAVLWAGLSWLDAGRTKDDLHLWSSACREGQLYRGDAFRQSGDLERAAEAYATAARPVPGVLSFSDEAAAFQNLGLTRLQQGRLEEAEAAFEQSLQRQRDALERRKLNHDLAAVAFARRDFAAVERRLGPEAQRADALPQSIELLRRSRAAAQSPPP